MKITPIHDNILVSLVESNKEEVSQKGIITALANPDKNESAHKGTVVALGAGPAYGKSEKPKYAFGIGDTIYFKEYSGISFEEEGTKYKIISLEDVLAFEKHGNTKTTTVKKGAKKK
ncbi:co-chaperone GroES [Mycoplasmoides pneumoniae]|uniref:Co-chaperonin GroES n=4 Tax=Mycoplasmoides pneumoniae TaxID=2104 RepID=CH10_MYCPN|nr:co-chaperone GroES [Mycoplasmoides pneumoniae]P75205.1 RecName: Full=Co-chaperonin GroES; AltName: Full=10 kDa chaperonin; AltName: Full=Chaperonin-10; Short=Cpn10 [Mycoplasmoides pneumoniae M129]AAB95916.1 heat shock protein GroES [Mycoplasmoides pneumoniae M129]ADK87242.1 chaperonin GroS [Mycoplasmoides pneumoniae FH]AGC04459.1 molecular chaperone GroES [Mycoplasmoides pneumoniae M129-B7]ALA30449.1 molecular chaperone GroES [Mycoplasmoides pneumoniae PI 1428]ALA30736.1 molecular chaperon